MHAHMVHGYKHLNHLLDCFLDWNWDVIPGFWLYRLQLLQNALTLPRLLYHDRACLTSLHVTEHALCHSCIVENFLRQLVLNRARYFSFYLVSLLASLKLIEDPLLKRIQSLLFAVFDAFHGY